MPSQEVTLPSFDELLHSLNGQNPPPLFGSGVQPSAGPTPPLINGYHPLSLLGNCVQPNAEPAPPPILRFPEGCYSFNINLSSDNCQSSWPPENTGSPWPPTPVAKASFRRRTRKSRHGYSVPKPSETWPPPHEKQDCSDFGCCSFLGRWSPFPRTYVDPLKTQGKSYTVYLHRPKWDERTSLPVLKNIPFISNDPGDQELGLPGVSVTRLLAMEPGILADSSSVILNAQSLWPTRAWSPQVRVKGHPRVKYSCYNNMVECKHAVLTHLGLAYSLASDFYRVIDQTIEQKPFDLMRLRLVALYTVDPLRLQWNVAYAIVDT